MTDPRTMTVGQLIAELAKHDAALPVFRYDPEYIEFPIFSVASETDQPAFMGDHVPRVVLK